MMIWFFTKTRAIDSISLNSFLLFRNQRVRMGDLSIDRLWIQNSVPTSARIMLLKERRNAVGAIDAFHPFPSFD
jgi:hypothetical protein